MRTGGRQSRFGEPQAKPEARGFPKGVAAMRGIKPKLGGNGSSEEERCAEQEAIYLIGLSDGLAFAELMALSVNERG